MQSRKRGRPSKPQEEHKRFRSVSIPEDLYRDLEAQSQALSVSIGKLATNRIRNGHYDHRDDESSVQAAHGNITGHENESEEFEP